MAAEAHPLPEPEAVYWRPRVTPARLRRRERTWTAITAGHAVTFLGTAALLLWLDPVTAPLAAVCAVKAWILPALYASRGANVLLPVRPAKPSMVNRNAERIAAGLLGDLVSHENRELHARTGYVTERGAFGTWVLGPAGAVLVRGGRGRFRRADCWCVRVADPALPSGDRIAHLLLALRADEAGFATVANLAFSGGLWRVRRRLKAQGREAMDAAAKLGRP